MLRKLATYAPLPFAAMKQYLCSHLVTLRSGNRETPANLERIWADGATVNAEEPMEAGVEVAILTPDCELVGSVESCESDAAGHFLEIALSIEWTLDKFVPDHLTDPDRFAAN
jgi:hypothetical protein